MHVIARKAIQEACRKHQRAAGALTNWLKATEAADWQNIIDVRKSYPQADAVEVGSGRTATIFNICGNNYRLITAIHYNRRKVYILRFLTHSEYENNDWKRQL